MAPTRTVQQARRTFAEIRSEASDALLELASNDRDALNRNWLANRLLRIHRLAARLESTR